jgi:hypothetical protein
MSLFVEITKVPVEEFFEQLRNVKIYAISKNSSAKYIDCRSSLKSAINDYFKTNFHASISSEDNATHIKISENQWNAAKSTKAWLYTASAKDSEKNRTFQGSYFRVNNPPKPEPIMIEKVIKDNGIELDLFKTAGSPASRKAKSQKILQIVNSELNNAGPLVKKYLKVVFFSKKDWIKEDVDAWLIAETDQCHFLCNSSWSNFSDEQAAAYQKQEDPFIKKCNNRLQPLNIKLIDNDEDYKDIKIIDPSKEK